MSAADEWRRDLEAWALPQELLDSADESPYGLPPELFRRRMEAAAEEETEPVTTSVLGRLLPAGGTLLDVGAGAGRASLPLAAAGHPLTAVEKSPGMIAALRDEAAGLPVTVVEGSWPEVAATAGEHDVAMCAHVVYDVQDIAPFLAALHRAARRAVVVELTPAHPWSPLTPYYRALHGIDRPAGPTADDLAAVAAEVTGATPRIERWARQGTMRFASQDELLALFRRRLLVGEDRLEELAAVLAPDLVTEDGWWYVGPRLRELVTVWWESG